MDVANQLAHRANAAALASGPFPVTVHELEAVRRELAGVREALDGGREVSAQGEREAIEARVRAEVLSEVGGIVSGGGRRRRRCWVLVRRGLGSVRCLWRVLRIGIGSCWPGSRRSVNPETTTRMTTVRASGDREDQPGSFGAGVGELPARAGQGE